MDSRIITREMFKNDERNVDLFEHGDYLVAIRRIIEEPPVYECAIYDGSTLTIGPFASAAEARRAVFHLAR